MKLRAKLIPALTAISCVAIVTPIVCTSCGANIYDMLHPYTTNFQPIAKLEADSWESANDFYFNSICENSDILDDDFAYTWAGCLNNPDSKALINSATGIEFSKYRFKIIAWRTSLTSEAINFEIACKVAGKVITDNSLILNGKNAKTFDLEIHYWVKNTVEIAFISQKSEIVLKEAPIICLNVDKSINYDQVAFTSIKGSYKYNNESGQEVAVNDYFSAESTVLSKAEPTNEGLIVSKKILFNIPEIGLQVPHLSPSYYNIYFASNYFKNLVVKE